MKNLLPALVGAFVLSASVSEAVIVAIDLSPVAGMAANFGANPYTRDHGVGLSGLNEPGILSGVGSGNEFGSGISYDTDTNVLSFDVAYGSAFGFTDLSANLTALHFHAPGNVNFPTANTNGGVILDLASFHTASGTRSGRITGTTVLSAANETRLIDNQLYLNVHSTAFPGGEIRGQLIMVPEPTTAVFSMIGVGTLLGMRRRRK